MRLLEAAGYQTARTAGSHGLFDIIAWNEVGFIFVQVKSNKDASPAEREALKLAVVPPNASKLIHRWIPRAKFPLMKEV